MNPATDTFFFSRGPVLQTGKRLLIVSQIINPSYVGQNARYRFMTAMATTTTYLYDVGLFVSRGVVLILNITSAEMCASYADREKEAREGPREATETKREGSHDRNHRLAFSADSNIRCTSRHQISRLPPVASVRALKKRSYTRSFPLFMSEAKGCVSHVSLAVFSDASQSLRSVSGSSR